MGIQLSDISGDLLHCPALPRQSMAQTQESLCPLHGFNALSAFYSTPLGRSGIYACPFKCLGPTLEPKWLETHLTYKKELQK
eukprot:1642703-Amphidinium_carterae.1